ncbi:Uncharacterized membrane protein [Allopseudospirillum japonicum]|uniref:Uncharacterized membrane protein n=1 Tax=Allopseudospirillum japonicum TaxID=64971 RepID=A0A1H6Q676_9GAMM|nr:energy-coupling factor ABC transporter permease [Allopseudospirillum japonicum]SEI39321.1 Uncharacterized membrane protein [Allopseudospirillum japonicum]
MSFSQLFPLTSSLIWANVLYAMILLWALWHINWRELVQDTGLQHLFLGTSVFAMLLWQMRAGLSPDIGIHFLLATTFTLMFRWPLALIATGLALLGTAWSGKTPWDFLGLNGLITGVIPVVVSHFIWRFVDQRLPDNYFVFVFANGFFGSALAALASGLSLFACLWLITSSYDFTRMGGEYLLFLPLVLPPEAVVNGMIISGLLAYTPHWVRTFDEQRYLDSQ